MIVSKQQGNTYDKDQPITCLHRDVLAEFLFHSLAYKLNMGICYSQQQQWEAFNQSLRDKRNRRKRKRNSSIIYEEKSIYESSFSSDPQNSFREDIHHTLAELASEGSDLVIGSIVEMKDEELKVLYDSLQKLCPAGQKHDINDAFTLCNLKTKNFLHTHTIRLPGLSKAHEASCCPYNSNHIIQYDIWKLIKANTSIADYQTVDSDNQVARSTEGISPGDSSKDKGQTNNEVINSMENINHSNDVKNDQIDSSNLDNAERPISYLAVPRNECSQSASSHPLDIEYYIYHPFTQRFLNYEKQHVTCSQQKMKWKIRSFGQRRNGGFITIFCEQGELCMSDEKGLLPNHRKLTVCQNKHISHLWEIVCAELV